MELRHLRYFVMAAEEANISRAASRLNVSQPAVSRQIRDLEDELGEALFERERNGLRLTPAGEVALVYAREVLHQASALVDAVAAQGKGRGVVSLKVGFLPTALPGFLAEGMRKFNKRYRNACVQIFEMSPGEQEEALRKGEIDIALIGEPRPELRNEFHIETVRETPMAIILPDDHRLAERKEINLSDLADETFLTLSEKTFPDRPRILADLFSRAGIDPEVTIRASGSSELLGLVGGGAGVAFAPADSVSLPHSGVRFLKMKSPRLMLLFSAAWRKTGDSSVIEKFVGILRGKEEE